MRKKLQPIYLQLCSVAVFQGVTESNLFKSFESFCLSSSESEKRKAYASFVSEVYQFLTWHVVTITGKISLSSSIRLAFPEFYMGLAVSLMMVAVYFGIHQRMPDA